MHIICSICARCIGIHTLHVKMECKNEINIKKSSEVYMQVCTVHGGQARKEKYAIPARNKMLL